MSWSVSAIGKSSKVAEKIEKYFTDGGLCAEPEEAVRQAARQAIAIALAGQTRPDLAVKVIASSHQNKSESGCNNTLDIHIEPIYGFVE